MKDYNMDVIICKVPIIIGEYEEDHKKNICRDCFPGHGSGHDSRNNSMEPEWGRIGITATYGGIKYRVSGKKAVVWKAAKKSITKAAVRATVRIGGKKYKVTGINKGAFKGCKKIKTVKVPKSCKKKYKKLLKKEGLSKKVKIK